MSDIPAAWRSVLDSHKAGETSAPLTLAKLMLADPAPRPDHLLPDLARADPALAELGALAAAQAARLDGLRRLVAGGLDPGDTLDATRALFDRLARDAPEAGVAIYSLGDPTLLADATAELADQIEAWASVEGQEVLDFGCGIGRLAASLATRGARVMGVDLSHEMIAEARRRVGGRAKFLVVGGEGLPELADGRFDAVIAADSFPYLVRAGMAVLRRQMNEFARLLRPGGDLLVFNWSYRGDPERDADEAKALAGKTGFDVLRAGDHPFRLWDARAFHLRRRG